MTNISFRKLSVTEEAEFRMYAQAKDPPKLEDWELYHPVCREVWTKRGIHPPKREVIVVALIEVKHSKLRPDLWDLFVGGNLEVEGETFAVVTAVETALKGMDVCDIYRECDEIADRIRKDLRRHERYATYPMGNGACIYHPNKPTRIYLSGPARGRCWECAAAEFKKGGEQDDERRAEERR